MAVSIGSFAGSLFPGAGFFGASDEFALSTDVGGEIDRAKLSIDKNAEILNIKSVEFFDAEGKIISLENNDFDISISSIYEPGLDVGDIKDKIKRGQMIHTKREDRPFLEIRFHAPFYCYRMRIRNRNDMYGLRSERIVISTYLKRSLLSSYRNKTVKSAQNLLEELNGNLNTNIYTDVSNFGELDGRAVVDRILHEINNESKISVRPTLIASMLDVLNEKPIANDGRSGDIIATLIFELMKERSSVPTSALLPFSHLLKSRRQIDDLRSSMQKIGMGRGGKFAQATISKHSIFVNRMEENRDGYLSAIAKLDAYFTSKGKRLCVCYGTLLGAIRDGKFIAHDDDVDLLYSGYATSAEEMRKERADLISDMREDGFNIYGIEENFHVYLDGVPLDIFPSWSSGGRTHMIMEHMRFRDVDSEILFPFGRTSLYGIALNAPRKPKDFLADRYGPSWEVPDPYHEWAWKVVD